MKAFTQYWTFSAMRGAMTLLAAVAIIAIPQAASFMLSLPVLLALAVDCLATYSLLDGGVMVLLAKLLPARAVHRSVLYGQMLVALTTGALLCLVVYGTIGVGWLMWIAATQAALAAVAELVVARDTHAQYGCFSCYSTAMILGLSALCLPFAGGTSPTVMSAALAAYVGLYGASELTLGARMLFLEYRSEHPASVASEAWKLEMLPLKLASSRSTAMRPAAAFSDCNGCPADDFCHDDSLQGKLAKVLAEKRPAIIVSVRAEALLHEAIQPVAA